jgi:hypothetical protein
MRGCDLHPNNTSQNEDVDSDSRIWYTNGADGYFGGAVDDNMIIVNGTSGSEEPRGLLNHSRGVLCWVTHHRGG